MPGEGGRLAAPADLMQHLYISYPPEDYDLAHRLAEDLQAAGYAVFIDPTTEVGTMAWAAETRRAIRSCGAMIMILSLGDRRRTGIRHEGVLAKRRQKPVIVLARSPGALPRYLTLAGATVIDGAGTYEGALERVLAALPPASELLIAPPTPQRPPHPPVTRRHRRARWAALAFLGAILLCIGLGIVFGLVPG